LVCSLPYKATCSQEATRATRTSKVMYRKALPVCGLKGCTKVNPTHINIHLLSKMHVVVKMCISVVTFGRPYMLAELSDV